MSSVFIPEAEVTGGVPRRMKCSPSKRGSSFMASQLKEVVVFDASIDDEFSLECPGGFAVSDHFGTEAFAKSINCADMIFMLVGEPNLTQLTAAKLSYVFDIIAEFFLFLRNGGCWVNTDPVLLSE